MERPSDNKTIVHRNASFSQNHFKIKRLTSDLNEDIDNNDKNNFELPFKILQTSLKYENSISNDKPILNKHLVVNDGLFNNDLNNSKIRVDKMEIENSFSNYKYSNTFKSTQPYNNAKISNYNHFSPSYGNYLANISMQDRLKVFYDKIRMEKMNYSNQSNKIENGTKYFNCCNDR